MNTKQRLLFLGILLLAVFFRFYLINQMPGGLFPDMAANGLDINLMQQGHLQPFYERGNGREALFFYVEWGSVSIFGKTVWAFSLTSAVFGLLAVLMCYFVAYRLFLMGEDAENPDVRRKAANMGLLAMFLMAVSSWHVVLSRTAFRATTIPFFSAITFYFLIRAYQSATTKTRLWFAFLTGAFFALGFYTYIAFRIMAPILFAVLVWPLLGTMRIGQFKKTVQKYFWPAAFLAIAFLIFVFPIAKYFYQHPGSFVGRAGQVSIFNPELYTVGGVQYTGKPPISVVLPVAVEVFKEQFLGFFTHGDLNWRQNISGYPFLSPLVSPFFGAGLLLMSVMAVCYFFAPNKRQNWWKYFFMVVWFFGMLLPVVTTAEGIPHGLRGIGVIPPIFIISAWALYEFAALVYKYHKKIWEKCWCHPSASDWETAQRGVQLSDESHPHFNRFKLITICLKVVVGVFCAALISQTYILYFVGAYNDPANFYYFRSDLTVVSKYLVGRCNKAETYLILDKFSVQTTDYLTSNRYGNFDDKCNVPYTQVDPENSWQLPALKPGQEAVFTQSSMFDTKKFKQYHPESFLKEETRNKFGQDVLAVYEGK